MLDTWKRLFNRLKTKKLNNKKIMIWLETKEISWALNL